MSVTAGTALSASADRLRPLPLPELIALDLAPRRMLLAPIIPEGGLAMINAARGVGKTHVALGVAHAVATGTRFLRWRAPQPRRVLLIDGEMPASALRERFCAVLGGAPPPATLEVLAADMVEGGIGDLAEPSVQAELEPLTAGVDLVVLDHLASLTASLRDEGWTPLRDWLIRLRRRGASVLLVHHAGRSGAPRGTGRREDVLDTSIMLRRPIDYVPSEGARFEVHITKGRALVGDAAAAFEARLVRQDAGARWITRTMVNVDGTRVATLLNEGLSVREVAAESGLSKSSVHRLKRRLEEEAAARMAEEPERGSTHGEIASCSPDLQPDR